MTRFDMSMNRPWNLLTASATVAAGMALPHQAHAQAQAQTPAQRRPNVLFIVADDQGPWTISAAGYPNTWTPQLDRIAHEGVLMRHAFSVAAVCSPSRAALLTSRYCTEVGIINIISKEEPGFGPQFATWSQTLRDAGYRTAMVGKWHLGHEQEQFMPQAKGYEYFSGFPTGGRTSRDPRILIDGEWKDFPGQYTSDVLADLAMGYIEQFRDEPFAISLHFWAPHANQGVPKGFTLPYHDRTWLPLKEEDLAPWKDMDLTIPEPDFPNLDLPRVDRMMREYYASVRSNDRNVGRVLDKLDELGLAENTIVIYTSDHGYMVGHHGLWHKGAGWWITSDRRDPYGKYTDLIENKPDPVRNNLFDCSIEVPCLVRWPARIKAGTETTETFTHLDWFPTLLAMCDVPAPQDAVLRGRNYLPVLLNQKVEWDNDMFAQHWRMRAYRTPQWKLVRDFEEVDRDELYHLADDPHELHNLIGSDDPQVKAVIERLNVRLLERMKQIDDPLYKLAQQIPPG